MHAPDRPQPSVVDPGPPSRAVLPGDVALLGPTTHRTRAPYTPHADRLPVRLQDHGDPVRYRNIWVRELAEAAP